MAELVYNIDDISLTSTWTRYFEAQGKDDTTVPYTTNLTGSTATRTITVSGIPDGEVVKRAMLSATLARSGTTDYGETIKVNDLNFRTGSRKLDSTGVANDVDMSLKFYFRATGNAGSNSSNAAFVNFSCTLRITNIVLTITTGVGSGFDGKVGSLAEGSKILIDEADGVQGTYSVIHHGYNEGLCLLWRDNCVASTYAFNHNHDSFLADNSGVLDKFLNTTFYESLPDTTKPYIQLANYPTRDTRSNGSVIDLARYVCTPSVRELKETTGYAEWYGYPFDYLDTYISGEVYWTRSISSTTQKSYRINGSGTAYTYDRSYPTGVRPCFCVLEEQIVTPGDADATYYVLASAVDAPTNIYLNGATADLLEQQRDATATLSWDNVDSPLVTGYEVWSCPTLDGEYTFVDATSMLDDGTIPTELLIHTDSKGFAETYFKVKAVTTIDTDYLDSDLSTNYRAMATKRTNVHYYDGTRWLLAMPNYYSDSWKQTEGMKYFNGSTWVVPGT